MSRVFLLCLISIHSVLYGVRIEAQNGEISRSSNIYLFDEYEQRTDNNIDDLFREANENREAFWAKCAEEIHWFQRWDKVLEWNCPYASWYLGGKLNICYNCVDRHLKKHGDKAALIWVNENGAKRIISYRQLHEDVCRLANALKHLGCQKGDFVTIYMPMVPEAVVSMLACARIGAVHSVVFGGTGAKSLKEKIEDANPKIVITADGGYRRGKPVQYKRVLDTALENNSSIEKVLVLKHTNTEIPFSSDRDIWYHEAVSQCDLDCPAIPMDSEDPLFVLYTSGTTGKAKGILHTTGGYLVGVHNTYKWVFDPRPGDIYWCTADIGWITGHSYVVYGPMSNCITQVIYEGAFDYPQKDVAWKIISDHKVTTFYTAPTLVRTLMKWGEESIANYDISSLRLLGSIGEPLNKEAWDWFYKYVGNRKCPIVDTWFQTETGAFVIAPIPGHTPQKPGSVTVPLPGYQVDILSDKGVPVSKGLLAITSPFPSMLRGILNNPDLYYRNYWAKWNGTSYYAGDAASKDEDGYIRVQGRADEVILVSGHRIGTAELEAVIGEHPMVAESAIIGLPDAIKGNSIVALVVLKDGYAPSLELEREIQQYVALSHGAYARPSAVKFSPDLPKTKSGKILRRVLLNLILELPIGDLTTLENKQSFDEITEVCGLIRGELLCQK